MNKSTLSALVVALMLGSGIAGYLIGKPGDSLDRPPPARTATTTQPAAPRPAVTPAAQPAAAPGEAFAYRRTSIDSSKPDGQACLYFNKPLSTNDSVKYPDYVRISPDVKSALRVVDDYLCVTGLAYGQDYAMRLLPGFPSQDGSQLSEEQQIDVALGARPAVVTLPAKGFILPRGTAAGLRITTLNVAKPGI